MIYDAIIIGTGQAGPTLATRLAASGLRTAIIEKANFGGTCVNNGCTPTKTLVASARAAHDVRRAAAYGIEVPGDFTVNMQKVKARKDAIVHTATSGLESWLNGTKNLDVFKGHARFRSNNEVEVNGEVLTADKIFINTGGRPRVPDYANQSAYLTNESMMDLDFIPEHLIVVGGSYIGLEFGQMYRRFGSEVTVIEMGDRLIGREDPEVSSAVRSILEAEGIKFRLQATCLNAHQSNNDIVVDVECAVGAPQVQGSHLLYAVGRLPNTDDLGLENTDIHVNERGYIEVNDELETSVNGIWALGDINGKGAFTHTSYNDHEIVADNLLHGDSRRVSDRIVCYGLYVDPPLARVGMTLSQARATGRPLLVGDKQMKDIARAKEKGETSGFLRVIVDAETERILGASMLGVGCDEIIHSVLDIMYADQPYTVIKRAVHIHPTVSELIPTLMGELKPISPN